MPISEGESNLVLNRDEYLSLDEWFNDLLALAADANDTFGGSRGSYWMDYTTFMATCGRMLTELANMRALAMRARKLNATLFADQDLEREALQLRSDRKAQADDDPPW